MISIALWLSIIAVVLPDAYGRCNNWCNRRGICSDPGDSGFCTCEIGYGGDDCSYMLCPRAFDPLTLSKFPGRKTIRVTTGLTAGVLSGSFSFEFFGSAVDISANLKNFNEELCSKTFSSLRAVGEASCQLEKSNEADGSGSFLVRFESWAIGMNENNLYSHSGRPSVADMICDVPDSAEETASGARCSVQDADTGGPVPEYAICAAHGSCDISTGLCGCDRGFHGPACDDTTDSQDIFYHLHDGPYFTGTLLKAKVLRTPSDEFNLFKLSHAEAINAPETVVTAIRGDGLLSHRGDIESTGRVTIAPRVSQARRDLDEHELAALSLDGRISESDRVRHQTRSTDILLHSIAGSDDQYHVRATLRDEEVFTLSADGNVTATSLGTMDGAFRVGDGLLHARDIAVEASLTVGGAAHVEDSLTLGSGFVLNPEGMTIDANRHSHALLELKSGATDFDSALLEIKASAQQASFIKGTVNGVTTFDLAASGDLQLNHIRLLSGGVHVSSGGVQVDAGGVMVQGGLTVASGGVSFLEGSVAASSISVQRGAESVDASALIAAGSSSASFVGTMLELSGAGAGEKGFTFIHATKKSGNDAGDDVFIVSSEGSVMAKGDMSVGGRFRSASGAVLEADVTLTKTTVSAGESIVIPDDAAFVEIIDDKKASANRIFFPTSDLKIGRRVDAGRVLIVTNSDAEATSGDASIPPKTTVLFVSDGARFVSVDALRAPMTELNGVLSLRAAADLDIGNHSLTAAAFILAADQAPDRNTLLYAGPSGAIRSANGLTYARGLLTTPSLTVGSIGGDVDFQFHMLEHAVLPNAILRNASVQAHDFSLTSKLSGLAFFDKNGRLSAVDSIKLSESGRPVFDQMDSDLDMKGNKLTNSIVINSVLENIINASIFNLKLTPYSSNIHEEDSVAVFVDGYVRSTGKAASITQTGHLKVASIGNFKMAGDIVGDGHNIFGAVLSGDKSSVANVNSVSTKSLRITSLQAPSQDISKPHRILVANHDGDVTTMSDGDSASGLRLSRLSIASGLTLDGPFTMSEHQELKAGNIIGNKGSFSSIAVKGSLVLAEDALSRANAPTGHGSQRILTVDTASGTVGAIGGVHIDNDGFLRFEHEGIAATSVRAGKLTLSGLDKAPEGVGTQTVLVVDKSGSVRAADGLSVSTIHAEGLAVTGSAHVKNLRVEALSGSGLVFADSSGDLSVVRTTDLDNLNVFAVDVSGSITAKKITLTDGVGSGGLLSVNAAGVVSVNQPVVVETIEVKQAKFSDVVIGSKITLSGLGETGDAAYLLSVDNNGVVTASKDASMNDLRAQNIAVSGVASVKSLAASNLRHSSESNLIVQADRDGHLVATANIISSMISAESITVEKSVKAGGLSITGLTLAGGALTDLLTANSDGVVSTTTGLNVNSLLTHSLTSSEVTITGSLLLSGVASPGYLTVGAAGEVSSSAALVAALATVEKLQVGETMTNSMHILGLSGAGGSLLSVDEVGKVQLSSEVKIAKVSVGTTATKELEVLGRVSLNGLSRSESEVGEILYRTEAGDIAVTDSALLTSVTATTLRVPGRAFFSGSVFIQDMPLGLLSIGNGGQVQSSANIHLPEGGIMRTPSAQIDESLTLNGKLEMIGNRYQVFDPKMEFNEVLAFPLGLNRADGAVEVMTSLVGLRELSAQNVTVKGSLTTDSLRIEGVSELGRPAVLSVGSNGLVLASSTIDVEIIYASTVEVSGSLSAADVVLDSLKVVPPGTLLCSKENGKFGPVDSASVLKTTSIAVEGDLSVSGRLQLTSIKPGVAVVDEGGLIASSGDVALDSLRVGKAATINEMTVLGSITMPGMSAVNKPLQGVMTLDGAALAFTRQLSLDAVTAKDLTVGGRASLDKVTIGTLTKENSGLLVVSSGEVGVTSDIAVQQMTATRLTVVEIRPPDKSGVAVVDARLSGRTILEEGAKITKAASIETNTLSVLSGPTFFRGAIDIEGNLDVRGHVMGSGPYHDSSDHRFKTNVTEVHGALAKVRALKPVTYNYRIDEFPLRGLPQGQQLGWIAQDVENLVPELVTIDDEGYMFLSYSHAAPLIAGAVAELAGEVDSLRQEKTHCDCSDALKELSGVQSELAALHAKMAAMEAALALLMSK